MEEYIYIDFDREVIAKKDIENNENIFFYYYQEPEEDFNSFEENSKDDYCWLCTYENPCECPPKMEERNPFEEDDEDYNEEDDLTLFGNKIKEPLVDLILKNIAEKNNETNVDHPKLFTKYPVGK